MELKFLPRYSTGALLAAVMAGPVVAQEVTISGATLFEDFFLAPANTSDFIDADNDGLFTDFTAPTFDNLVGAFGTNTNQFQQQYRAIGSGNGFQELVDFGSVNGPGTSFAVLNAANTGDPNVVNSVDQDASVANFRGPATIDIATTDVPSVWAVQNTNGPAAFGAAPLTGSTPTPGYGSNPLLSNAVRPTSTPPQADQAGGFNNDLQTLTPSAASPGSQTLTLDAADQSGNRIYQTPVALSPIAFISNAGVGLDSDTSTAAIDGNTSQSEMQHLFASGRTVSGENLIAITRDSGSGTRNGAMNSIGLDPSWGSGDNVGSLNRGSSSETSGSNLDTPGSDFIPNQKQSSSRMEVAVENIRLGVGYQGIVGNAGPDSDNDRYEILNIKNDLAGGTEFVRPVLNNVVPNGDRSNTFNNIVFNEDPDTGYQIGSIQTLSTIGNPFAGTIYVDANGVASFTDPGTPNTKVFAPVTDPVIGEFTAGDPAMEDPYAALYIRNIEASIEAFTAAPSNPANDGTPGQFLAANFALVNAAEALPDGTAPESGVANPNELAILQSSSVLPTSPIEAAYGGTYGNAPSRDNRGPSLDNTDTYSDGLTANYLANDGTAIAYSTEFTVGSAIGDANAIAGDFDGNLLREAADIDDMVIAYEAAQANNRASLTGSKAKQSLEIIGDFDADGNFDLDDVRYGADGLFSRGRAGDLLDRKQNYIDVDAAATGGNLFGTSLATGVAYEEGDSRGDVAGSGFEAAGWAPLGFDGVVDGLDIDFVWDNYIGLDLDGSGGVEWANLDEVTGRVLVDGERVDLSADMTGDLIINDDDIAEIVEQILGTSFGDVNLDGSVTQADLDIATANENLAGGWADGDTNGDDVVDAIDLAFIQALLSGVVVGDFNTDGFVSQPDLDLVLLNWGDASAPAGFDENALGTGGPFDGLMSQNELDDVLLNWGDGTPPPSVNAIPEPASALLLTASGLLLARRRK